MLHNTTTLSFTDGSAVDKAAILAENGGDVPSTGSKRTLHCAFTGKGRGEHASPPFLANTERGGVQLLSIMCHAPAAKANTSYRGGLVYTCFCEHLRTCTGCLECASNETFLGYSVS